MEVQARVDETTYTSNQPISFKTPRARQLYSSLLSKLKSYTPHEKTKELLCEFDPTTNKKIIFERHELCKQSIELAKKDVQKVQSLIRTISTIKTTSEKKHPNIVIAFGDEELYKKYRSELSKKFYVTLIENENDFLQITHYESIRYIPGDAPETQAEQLDNVYTIVGTPDIIDIAPEFITDILDENEKGIQAIQDLHTIIPLKYGGNTRTTIDHPEHFMTVQRQSETICQALKKFIITQISSMNFSGDKMLEIQSKGLMDIIPDDIREKIIDKKIDAANHISALLGLDASSYISISQMGDVEIEKWDEIEKKYRAIVEQRLAEVKSKNAKENTHLVKQLHNILSEVYALDCKLCIGLFITEYKLEQPEIIEKGISFVYGRNITIKDPVPIEYYLDNQIAILTGANSGGKTTLLDLLSQIQLLAQMGLFVPAKECKVGIVDEFYYFTKSRGSASGGAFETLLKQFASITNTNLRSLILADEIESVTEPDIAASIIKGIIAHVDKPNTTAVIVTHMGRQLQGCNARFDGIEAKGLDQNNNLVVDRNPCIGKIARSTPQLIIERLSKKSESPFYSLLLKKIMEK